MIILNSGITISRRLLIMKTNLLLLNFFCLFCFPGKRLIYLSFNRWKISLFFFFCFFLIITKSGWRKLCKYNNFQTDNCFSCSNDHKLNKYFVSAILELIKKKYVNKKWLILQFTISIWKLFPLSKYLIAVHNIISVKTNGNWKKDIFKISTTL